MYDELFDVLFEEYLNDTDILNEDAGGARGKYVQIQKEKLKKLEEKKKKLIDASRDNTTSDDAKRQLKQRITEINAEINATHIEIKGFSDASGNKHDPQTIRNNRQRKYVFTNATANDMPDEHTWVHDHINSKAEYEERQKNK